MDEPMSSGNGLAGWSFLQDLNARLRGRFDPVEIRYEATCVLGEHLGADRVGFAECDGPDRRTVVVGRHFVRGVPGIEGRHRLDDFGAAVLEALSSGRVLLRDDVLRDPALRERERAAHAALQVGAMVVVPLADRDGPSGLFFVHQRRPRTWTEREVAVIEAVALCTRIAVDHARDLEALRASELRLRTAKAAARIGVHDYDRTRDRIFWDEHVRELWGVGPDEPITYSTFASGLHPDDAPAVEAALARAFDPSGDGRYVAEFRVRDRRDGTQRRVHATGQAFFEACRAIRLVGTAQDVTDERERAQRHREDRERLLLALEATSLGLWDHDLRTGLSVLNAQASRMLGLEPQDGPVPHERWRSRVHPEDRPRVDAAAAAAREGGGTYACEHRVVLDDGSVRWISPYGRFIRDGDEPVRFVGVFRDVTERKHEELALRTAHQTFRHLVEQSPFGVYVVDADFRLTVVSAGARRVFENVRPLIGRDFAQVLRIVWPEPFATTAIERFRRTLETGEPYRSQRTVEPRRDIDETQAYDWQIERIVLPDGRAGVVCHFYDLSERQAHEAALREADRRKDRFLAELSHELRNPLAAIRNALRLLEREALPDRGRDAVGIVARQAAQLARLVDDLLEVSRIDTGKVAIRLERLCVQALVAEVVAAFAPTLAQRRQRLEVDTPPEPIGLDADPVRLAQVLENLLANASKHTGPGGTVTIRARRSADRVVVEVRDTGAGIPRDRLEQIFELFCQLDPGDGVDRGGLGIGLALVRKLVELHGGSVRAHSDGPGTGATFVVALPAADGPARAPA